MPISIWHAEEHKTHARNCLRLAKTLDLSDAALSEKPLVLSHEPDHAGQEAKTPIDSVTKWTPTGTEAGGGGRENT
jgi:hypothetical protein